jgi:predicted transcriptional regulator
MTAQQIIAELGDGLAYSTMMTTLGRLERKQAITKERRGSRYFYQGRTDAPSMTAGRMRSLLDSEPDRAAVLIRFVASLPTEDAALVASVLTTDGGAS